MPGRDTAPGLLLRRLACAGDWPAIWPNEPKLLNRNTEGAGGALQVTARSKRSGERRKTRGDCCQSGKIRLCWT